MRRRALILILLSMAVPATLVVGATEPTVDREASDPDLVRLEGIVDTSARSRATLTDDAGTEYRIHLGPLWFYRARGWELSDGDRIEVAGRVETIGGVQHLYARTIRSGEETFELVDEDGSPVWWNERAGRSGGGGRGACLGGGRAGPGCCRGRYGVRHRGWGGQS